MSKTPEHSCATAQAPDGRVCRICGERAGYDRWGRPAKDHIRGDLFRIIRCSQCDVSRTSPIPADLSPYYPEQYRHYGPVVGTVLTAFYRAHVGRWTARFEKPGRVLDIGCGAGVMLEAFLARGWDVVGVERCDRAAEAAQAQGLTVVTSMAMVPTKPSGFDLILLFNSLEHVIDPVNVLQDCVRYLAPDGRLIISVPNMASYQARFAGPHWLHLDPPRHLYHFSPRGLEATLGRVGLRIESLSCISLEHDPYGWVESLLNLIGCRQNLMTGLLMGLRRFSVRDIPAMALWGGLLLPALILSGFSWLTGQGALLRAVAVRDQ